MRAAFFLYLAAFFTSFLTFRVAALPAFAASFLTLCEILSCLSLADIRPLFKTTCWLGFWRFAYAYTAAYIIYKSSSANM